MVEQKPKEYALCCPVGETGMFSSWSISHFFFGYTWNLAWSGVSAAVSGTVQLQTLNLWVLMFVGFLFELVENDPTGDGWMWSWLGYTQVTYVGDTATNAISDMLFVLLGWTLVEGVLMISTEAAVFAVLGGGAALILLLFAVFFLEERKILLPRERAAKLPAVLIN
jgi:hypothetical protein